LRLFVYFTAATVVPILVAFLNLLAYGKFETVDFTNRSFSTALSVFKWFETEGLIS